MILSNTLRYPLSSLSLIEWVASWFRPRPYAASFPGRFEVTSIRRIWWAANYTGPSSGFYRAAASFELSSLAGKSPCAVYVGNEIVVIPHLPEASDMSEITLDLDGEGRLVMIQAKETNA